MTVYMFELVHNYVRLGEVAGEAGDEADDGLQFAPLVDADLVEDGSTGESNEDVVEREADMVRQLERL